MIINIIISFFLLWWSLWFYTSKTTKVTDPQLPIQLWRCTNGHLLWDIVINYNPHLTRMDPLKLQGAIVINNLLINFIMGGCISISSNLSFLLFAMGYKSWTHDILGKNLWTQNSPIKNSYFKVIFNFASNVKT